MHCWLERPRETFVTDLYIYIYIYIYIFFFFFIASGLHDSASQELFCRDKHTLVSFSLNIQ